MPSPSLKTDARYTYGDYLTWTNEARWEIIEGVAYCMSPAPTTTHQRISGALFSMIYNHVTNKGCEVFSAPFDVRLGSVDISDDNWETVVQPDISVICDEKKVDDRGCRGAPDWIIEIISPSTASRDHIQKRRLYEKHGVKEYWLVDPTYRLAHIYRIGKDGGYSLFQVCSEEEVIDVDVLPDFRVDLTRVFPRQ